MYNQLPSTVLREATTFDIMVADVYSTWERSRENPADTEHYKQEDLMDIMKSARGEQ
jgi:hypothetical protein